MTAGRLQQGFTLMELMVVFAIAALVVGLAVPYSARMYDSMQYRSAVRTMQSAAASARYQAITSGRAVDLIISPDERRYVLRPVDRRPGRESAPERPSMTALGGNITLDVVSAAEVSPGRGLAAIRFYPEGNSTGGSVSIRRNTGAGVRLRVDWLLGRVTQESLDRT